MAERVELADPFKAVRGWNQDYWLLRLLDPRGLDVYGPGGPYDPEVAPGKAWSRSMSFFNFAERLASLGWVIVWRSATGSSARVVAVPAENCVIGDDTEVKNLGGLVGVALGLPWSVARLLYKDSIARTSSLGLVNAAVRMAATRETPPAYRRFLEASPEAMAVLECLIGQTDVADEIDLSSMLIAAEAAAAA